MNEPHNGAPHPADTPIPELAPTVFSFDGQARLALTFRMAGYSDDQVAKLIARGFPEGAERERRAA